MRKILILIFLCAGLASLAQQSSPRFLYLPGTYSLHYFSRERSLFATGDSIQLLNEYDGNNNYELRYWTPDTDATLDDSTGNAVWYIIGYWNYLPYDSSAEYVDGYFLSWDLEDTTKFQASWNCWNELQLQFKDKLLIKRVLH